MDKQLQLIKDPRKKTKSWWVKKQHAYGGSLNYRKVARPFDSKRLTHAVFKARLGNGIWFTRSQSDVSNLLKKAAQRYEINLHDVAINKDHLHLAFYTKKRTNHIKFLRFVSAELGRKYARIHRRFGLKSAKIWIARPFTRLVSWGRRSRLALENYLKKNRDEATGFIEYTPRNHALGRFLSLWQASVNSG